MPGHFTRLLMDFFSSWSIYQCILFPPPFAIKQFRKGFFLHRILCAYNSDDFLHGKSFLCKGSYFSTLFFRALSSRIILFSKREGNGTLRYGTYVTIRYGTIRYDTLRYGTIRYGTVVFVVEAILSFDFDPCQLVVTDSVFVFITFPFSFSIIKNATGFLRKYFHFVVINTESKYHTTEGRLCVENTENTVKYENNGKVLKIKQRIPDFCRKKYVVVFDEAIL